MYNLDHMLNGTESLQHHQELIRQAEYARLASDFKSSEEKPKALKPLRAILAAIMFIIGSI